MIPLKTSVLAILLFVAAIAVNAETVASEPVLTFTADDDYESVKENLQLAITGQGLRISGTLHVQEMLARTSKDLGYDSNIYAQAESFEFCSADISHRMIRADPRNLTVCPFTISFYTLAANPEQVFPSKDPCGEARRS